MIKKIQKVEKALINAGIEYDFAIDFNSKLLIETSVLKWWHNGKLMVFTEDDEGFTSCMITNPDVSGIIEIIEGKVL